MVALRNLSDDKQLEAYLIGPGLPGLDAEPMTIDEAVELALSRPSQQRDNVYVLCGALEPETIREKWERLGGLKW